MDPTTDENMTTRMLSMFERLYKAAPFHAEHTVLIGLYRRIHETLPIFLSATDVVAQKAFKIIWESHLHNPLSVEVIFDSKSKF